jgi:uncharacterized delta-60 repeat protein
MTVGFESLEPRRFLDAGSLDLSFGDNGDVEFNVPAGQNVRAWDLDVNQSSQVVVTVISQAEDADHAQIDLLRLHPDGSRDLRFGPAGDGVLTLPIPRELMRVFDDNFFAPMISTVTTPDSGILVQIDNLLYKFANNGKPDRGFGGGKGKLVTTFPQVQQSPSAGVQQGLQGVDVDAQGRIYLVGIGTNSELVVRRLNSEGSVDATFGTNGTLTPPGNIEPTDFRIRVLTDGSIVAGGMAKGTSETGEFSSAAFDLSAIKLTPAGTLDTTYGDGTVSGGDGVARDQLVHTDLATITGNTPVISSDGFVFLSITNLDQNTAAFSQDIAWLDANGGPMGSMFLNTPETGGGQGDVLRDDQVMMIAGKSLGVPAVPILGPSGPVGPNPVVADLPGGFFPSRFGLQRDGAVVVLGGTDEPDSVVLHRIFRDDAPVGQLSAKTLAHQRAASYRFTVQWRDDDGMFQSWLGNDDLTVGFPNGTRRNAHLLDTEVLDGGRAINATYYITASDGVWDSGDNGKYSVRVERRSVQDVDFHVAARREIGQFFMQIPEIEIPPGEAAIPFDLGAVAAPMRAGSGAIAAPQQFDFDALARGEGDEKLVI